MPCAAQSECARNIINKHGAVYEPIICETREECVVKCARTGSNTEYRRLMFTRDSCGDRYCSLLMADLHLGPTRRRVNRFIIVFMAVCLLNFDEWYYCTR